MCSLFRRRKSTSLNVTNSIAVIGIKEALLIGIVSTYIYNWQVQIHLFKAYYLVIQIQMKKKLTKRNKSVKYVNQTKRARRKTKPWPPNSPPSPLTHRVKISYFCLKLSNVPRVESHFYYRTLIHENPSLPLIWSLWTSHGFTWPWYTSYSVVRFDLELWVWSLCLELSVGQ